MKLPSFQYFLLFSLFTLILSSCNSINADKLYGEWKYVEIKNLDVNDQENISADELQFQNPSISFYSPNKLSITWGGKILSHGTFKMENQMIRYTELLEDGRTRDFPFLIKELTDTVLIFETMMANGTRIKAIKKAY
ncbi:hypothetical protein [Daejeonella oryzae]|uniref:hypothetical protein n=1 Tax=Daejeonella oryzae TaxID=1122943 RepID=UPI00047DF8E2|nr:hypothetical protein [Daejeonella oryzae]